MGSVEGAGGVVVRRDLEEDRSESLGSGVVKKLGQKGSGLALTAGGRMCAEGQDFTFTCHSAGQKEGVGAGKEEGGGLGKEAREFISAPAPVRAEGSVVEAGKLGGGHGRIDGIGAEDGVASGARR